MDKPILFSGPMVRALLDGRKTQTRRIIKPQPPATTSRFYRTPFTASDGGRWVACFSSGIGIENYGTRGPGRRIFVEGDRLWVRESWAKTPVAPIVETIDSPWTVYRACDSRTDYGGPWKPSIHMRRNDSRLTLLVTEVRVQRIQEITSADAIAEGCRPYANSQTIDCCTPNPRDDFRDLWRSINGPGAWAANPWVAAYTFTVHRCNVDSMAEAA